MIFRKKTKSKVRRKSTGFLTIVYYHNIKNMRADISDSILKAFFATINNWRKRLPEDIIILDMVIACEQKSRVDIEFFSVDKAVKENTDLQKLINTLKKVLAKHVEKKNINGAREFFEYEGAR
jgi:hypothetical protein